ncbi:hypothetical protein RJ639_006981 [Escallonia herrerae]|uniref:FAS1 domain-containing protein n=1 Tax=Escallonia herrerae TaxID=1293975 RepID=A0AA88VZ23_9ASTE|nr:hypothetical protein RJ639_006981 [Escallonia herrerae]
MDMLLNALTLKGYSAMSLILRQTLEETSIPYAVNPNTTFTIFCPPDEAFLALKYTHPPVTLLQYHAVPLKLDKKSIELSFQLGSKLDTLLPGYPLLVTRPPNGGHVFINEVRITEWDVYRDNRFIIHGVEDFFDPALQTVIKEMRKLDPNGVDLMLCRSTYGVEYEVQNDAPETLSGVRFDREIGIPFTKRIMGLQLR